VFEQQLVICCIHHFREFYGCPKILHTIKKTVYEGEHCHHKSVLQMESFSSCCAHLETKLKICSFLYHYELSQQFAWYKILNTTEHE
jgi:hypothetical protein